jgi:hypothetical protein
MAEGSNPKTDQHTLIYEVEKRNKAGESLDGLRSDILRYLIAFRETPTGAEIFPKAVDGRDSSSGFSFSVDEHDAVDQVLQSRAPVQFSPA